MSETDPTVDGSEPALDPVESAPPATPAPAPGVTWTGPDEEAPGLTWTAPTEEAPTQPWSSGRESSDPPGCDTCPVCGGVIDPDGYCTQCGAKAQSGRDHYSEAPASWVAGVCDIGLAHQRNEDALATAATTEPGQRAVIVVCDGVTTSQDSDLASLAAARRARDLLWLDRPQGLGLGRTRATATAQRLRQAVEQANLVVIETTAPDSSNPASSTIALALVDDSTCFWASLGDSRVYWLPDLAEAVLLSRDHSLAQAQIDQGVDREVAEASALAHTITKWLGLDATDLEPCAGRLRLDQTGWLLVCSDGLWNYASSAADMRQAVERASREPEPTDSPLVLAQRLVDWANGRGGHDNVTVGLARCLV
ncbi:MAG: serine/threonine-protein phosphatase [Propionibacteriaceae bacterium]|jgi:serine/threonine protein phosphatase PrpC|nr:serine/threonine-protein phosphatase [Propionibacteriaceae bacterium]